MDSQYSGSMCARQFTCAGCRSPILDQFVLRVAPDLEWHAECLRCSECHNSLDENCTCFVRDGKVYCKPDYVRLFGTRCCAKCQERFAKNDLVMRAKSNIYHVTCFRCAICCRQLVSGDEFSLRDDAQLLCKTDHEATYNNNNNNNNNINVSTGGGIVMGSLSDDMCVDDVIISSSGSNNNDMDAKAASDTSSSHSDAPSPDLLHDGSLDQDSVGPPTSGAPGSSRHRSHQHGSFHHHHHGGGGRSGSGRGHHRGHGDHHHKTTRIRTVLNEKQLHMLRTCYSANSRPDALMKEQLVEMTGLSPRVIRVWFQNKRCKDKKRSIALKQLHQQQQNKSDGCHLDNSWIGHKGVPLIATSPVRHEPPINILPSQVEVHKFPGGPWPIDVVIQSSAASIECGHDAADTSAANSPLPSPGGTGSLPLSGLQPDRTNAAAGLVLHTGTSSSNGHHGQQQSLGDSFDDDTVVSFDDLSDVVMPTMQTCGGSSGHSVVTSSGHHTSRSPYASATLRLHDDILACHGGQRHGVISLFGTADGHGY